MAVYIELAVEDVTNYAHRTKAEGRDRAGVKNVRRPFRGIEWKSDTYAVFRVYAADGTEIKLVDSSWPEGEGRGYANFLLQSVQEARVERQQMIETFGSSLVFFFGESPRFVDVTAILLNTHDFNWEAEWWRNYQDTLRGTRLVEQGARALLCFDDTIIEGYPMNASVVKQSGEPNLVQLQFRMFVTNQANVSNVGDPNFPVHAEATVPQQLNQRDDRTFAFEVEPPQEASRRVLGEYLKRLGIAQIQQEIANARTIEEARAIQRQYALEQLGVVPEGANLLTLGSSFFQGVVAGVRGDGESLDAANQRFRQEAQKALQLSKEGRLTELDEMIRGKTNDPVTGAVVNRSGPGNPRLLVESLRNALTHTANYPAQDLQGFLDRVSATVFPNGTKQLLEAKRTLPWRSRIIDNIDEYTGTTQEQSEQVFEERTGVPVAGSIYDLPAAIQDASADRGAIVTPDSLYQMGLNRWTPKPGVNVSSNPFAAPNPFGNPQVRGTGELYRYTYSRSWGTTPGAGGASGGGLGGGFGPGVGGKAQDPSQLKQLVSGLPSGTSYGGQGVLPPFGSTQGTGPDRRPLYKSEYKWGSTPDGSLFSGNATIEAVRDMDGSVRGSGAFSIQVLDGELV